MIETKLVVDCSTGQTTEIPLTKEEISQRKAEAEAYKTQEEERLIIEKTRAEAEASAVAKLEGLGLTSDEILALKG
jgi:hypothetical protein